MVRAIRYTSPITDVTDYVVLDTETTGIDPNSDRIIEVGLVEVYKDTIVDQYSSLVHPGCHIPARASEVNHIYDADVAEAPGYGAIAPILAKWLIGKTVIAHNAPFDMKFVQNLLNEFGYSGTIKYIDTIYYARRVVSGVDNYKLQTLATYFQIDPGNAHRALDDARVCHYLFQKCKELSPDSSIKQAAKKIDNPDWISANEIVPSKPVSGDSLLYDKIVVFTGDLSISRRAAMQKAVDAGAIVKDHVAQNTDYLVEGTQNPAFISADGISNKQKMAAEINTGGKGNIRVISESEFMGLCDHVPLASPPPNVSKVQNIGSAPPSAPVQKSEGKESQRILRVIWLCLQWIFALFALLVCLGLYSSRPISALFFLGIAFLSVPVKFIRNVLEQLHINGIGIVLLIILLFIIALFF